MRVSQPVGQKRHTNIAIVSVRKKVEGKEYKFEIACYPNKVLNQREGIETDLAQVLQTETVFTNVSRGDVATQDDLQRAFGTTSHRKICEQIIKEGHLQVSDKEREYITESRTRDILNAVAQMTMDASTGYPLTVTQIQAALDDIHFRISAKSSMKGSKATKARDEEEEVKQIARDCVKRLEAELPHRISRVNMILRLVASGVTIEEVRQLAENNCLVQSESDGSLLITCHPRVFKVLKDSFGERVQSLTVVDSFAHKVLPNASISQSPKVVEKIIIPDIPVVPAPTVPRAVSRSESAHACATCGDCTFENAMDFRKHCKSEWHAFNKKRQVKGLPFMDHMEFEMIPEEFRSAFNAVDP
jgi:ribosome maturation protein SDO1